MWPYEAYVGPLQGERVRQKWTRVGVKKCQNFVDVLYGRPLCELDLAVADPVHFTIGFSFIVIVYWHSSHGLRSRVYVTVGCQSVCLSACLSQHGPTAANPLLQVCCCGPGRQEIAARPCCARQQQPANAGSETLSAYPGS